MWVGLKAVVGREGQGHKYGANGTRTTAPFIWAVCAWFAGAVGGQRASLSSNYRGSGCKPNSYLAQGVVRALPAAAVVSRARRGRCCSLLGDELGPAGRVCGWQGQYGGPAGLLFGWWSDL